MPTPARPRHRRADRPYRLEQIDDAAVVQLYADGFAELTLDDKILVWHLYQAALAGRDIYYDQRYRHNLAMRDILEEILTHADGIRRRQRSPSSRATPSCSGSTAGRTTTSRRASSCCSLSLDELDRRGRTRGAQRRAIPACSRANRSRR